MNTDIGIKKDVQPHYIGEEIAVIAILNYLQNDKNENLFISVDAIGYFLIGRFINSQNDKNLIKGIKEGFVQLDKRKDVCILDQNRSNYIIDSKSCRIDNEKNRFIILKINEIQKIFSSFGAYGFGLLRFYVNIIGTINGNNKSWHMTQDDMSFKWSMSKNTVIEYLSKLEDLELLYVFRSNSRRKDDTFHKLGNSYGRFGDKELIIEEGKKYLDQVPNRPIEHYFINRTSIKLKYNYLIKGAKRYTDNPKLIKELYKDCIKYNESFKDFPNQDIDYIDLSIFKDYGFHNVPVYEKGNQECLEPNNSALKQELQPLPNLVKAEEVDSSMCEFDLLEHEYPIDEILDMPSASNIRQKDHNGPSGNIPQTSSNEYSCNTSINNPVKVISIKQSHSKEQENRIPKDILVEYEAKNLFREYGDRNEISLFIESLSEKFPGLDDYQKYWDYEKKMQKLFNS